MKVSIHYLTSRWQIPGIICEGKYTLPEVKAANTRVMCKGKYTVPEVRAANTWSYM